MTLQECYAALGGDYEDVIGRLRSERLVQKFVLKFLEDKSYDLLCTSFETANWDDAFRAAHTIKGMCQNLGFSRLGASGEKLTESLRGGKHPGAEELLEQVKTDYKATEAAIRAYSETL